MMTPLGAEEIENLCICCGWPKPNILNMLGDGKGLTDIPGKGRLFITLLRKDQSESWDTGRFKRDCELRVSAEVDDTMLTHLVPGLWDYLHSISTRYIKWSAIPSAVGGGIEISTVVDRFNIVTAQERVYEMFELKKRLQTTVQATSQFFVQVLKS